MITLFNLPPKDFEFPKPIQKSFYKLPRCKGVPKGITPAQRFIYKTLLLNSGYLVLHKNKRNKFFFRIIDQAHNPLKNVRYGVVKTMLNKEWLEKDGNIYRIQKNIINNPN